jgi:ATP-dependent RNA helicase RhlE
MRFDELRLGESIVRAVTAAGYERPTPIQVQAVPAVLDGRDVLGCAQTGTGKTAAFAMPILQRLADGAVTGMDTESLPQGRRSGGRGQGGSSGRRSGSTGSAKNARRRGARDGRSPRALVLCPTRELATQILESFETYGQFLPLDHIAVFGGVSQFHQVNTLHDGVDVLVATPGRLQDLMQQRLVDLRDIEVLVLDEADQMLDMGFIHDIRRIVAATPDDRQTLFFSATMAPAIRELADAILRDPQVIKTTPVATPAAAIRQSVHMVNRPQKPALLVELLADADMERTLVFSRTKYGADKLVKMLTRSGIEAAAIHANKSQGQRTKALAGFKSGRTSVLVATDIAARGIDVDGVTHVVNYDIPNVPETYVHRIGRTARAGASGIAISLCDPTERDSLRAIERLTGVKPTVVATAGGGTPAEERPARPARAERPARRDASAASPKSTSKSKSKSKSKAESKDTAPRAKSATASPKSKSKPTPAPRAHAEQEAATERSPKSAGRPAGAPRKRIPRRPAIGAAGGPTTPRRSGGTPRTEDGAAEESRQTSRNGSNGTRRSASPPARPKGGSGGGGGGGRSGGRGGSGSRSNPGGRAATPGATSASRTRSGNSRNAASGSTRHGSNGRSGGRSAPKAARRSRG